MRTKIVKCPNCDYETDVGILVRRKFCKCGRLMKEIVE